MKISVIFKTLAITLSILVSGMGIIPKAHADVEGRDQILVKLFQKESVLKERIKLFADGLEQLQDLNNQQNRNSYYKTLTIGVAAAIPVGMASAMLGGSAADYLIVSHDFMMGKAVEVLLAAAAGFGTGFTATEASLVLFLKKIAASKNINSMLMDKYLDESEDNFKVLVKEVDGIASAYAQLHADLEKIGQSAIKSKQEHWYTLGFDTVEKQRMIIALLQTHLKLFEMELAVYQKIREGVLHY